MQVNITFRHLEPTEALKAHVKDKVEHIQRYVDRPDRGPRRAPRREPGPPRRDHHEGRARSSLRGRAKSEDMYASIDDAADKIERQLKKHKSKLQDHKVGHVEQVPIEVRHDVLDIISHPERPSHRVAKSTVFQAKEMTVDEAILQLDLLGSQFFVFQNAADRAINVLYRREDGSLGLIEARSS